jgi:hypothetical protein
MALLILVIFTMLVVVMVSVDATLDHGGSDVGR